MKYKYLLLIKHYYLYVGDIHMVMEAGMAYRYRDSLTIGRPGDRIAARGDISRTRPDRTWGHPAPVQRVLGLFAGGKAPGAWR
jgi:hypothetical protein